MRRKFIYRMTDSDEGTTVGAYLKSRGYSKKLIITLKRQEDALTIGGKTAFISHKIISGEILQVKLPAESFDSRILPSEMPLSIIYEDDDLLVVNKDAGVPVHPSHGHQEYTLANGLMRYFAAKQEPFTFRVVNRLDRDTTGLLIIARHALSAGILSGQLREHAIRRTYLAALSGDLRNTFPKGCGTVSAPIARVRDSVIEREVNYETGEPSVTHVRLLSYDAAADTSLAELCLDTGRTHQIRVHMKYIGHPLYGDFLYNPDYRLIKRQSLHSWKLAFSHPFSGANMSFTAPVPDDMQRFIRG